MSTKELMCNSKGAHQAADKMTQNDSTGTIGCLDPRARVCVRVHIYFLRKQVEYGERNGPYPIIFSLGQLIALRTSESSEVVAICQTKVASSFPYFHEHRLENSRFFPLI